jgi:hypothetical protein
MWERRIRTLTIFLPVAEIDFGGEQDAGCVRIDSVQVSF